MTRKLVLLVLAMVMTVLSITLTPKPVFASCSGDDCGCGVQAQECLAYCEATFVSGSPAYNACTHDCFLQNHDCALGCCAG